jgi:hypothetical protein
MVGNGAWSYTLNRINPVKLSSNETNSKKVEETFLLTRSFSREGCPVISPVGFKWKNLSWLQPDKMQDHFFLR